MTSTSLVVAHREGFVPRNGPAAMQLALDLGASLDPVSLTLTDPAITIEDWEAIGKQLGFVDHASTWWIADWMNVGEALFGELAADGADTRESRFDVARRITGKEPSTLQNYRSVAEKVPPGRRREELTFAHHAEVAPLEPAMQEHWLDKAVAEQWTRSRLREAIRDARDGGGDEQGETGSVSISQSETRRTVGQRIEAAARDLLHVAQPLEDGRKAAPPEAWARLAEAFGEE